MSNTLSTHLLTQADELQAIAHLVARHDGQLAARIVLQACRLGLASGAAKALERDLRIARATARALGDESEEDAAAHARAVAAIEARHARSQTIAEILAPVLARTANPDSRA